MKGTFSYLTIRDVLDKHGPVEINGLRLDYSVEVVIRKNLINGELEIESATSTQKNIFVISDDGASYPLARDFKDTPLCEKLEKEMDKIALALAADAPDHKWEIQEFGDSEEEDSWLN